MSFPDSAVHHGAMVPYRGPEIGPLAGIPDKDTFMLDVPSWLAPSIPHGVGPMVPYHGPDVDLDTYNGRPDDPNPRPHKFVEGEGGTRWGIGPSVPWHGHTPTEMDYILGRLD
jgi:hypothetical protein